MMAMLLETFMPLIVPAVAGIVILLLGALGLRGRWLALLTGVAIVIGLFRLEPLMQGGALSVGQLFVFDAMSVFFIKILYVVTLVIAFLARCAMSDDTDSPEVYYGILLFALFGMIVVVSTSHLAVFFLGLEIYTACLFILISFYRDRSRGTEAAIKYLILSAVSSGFILLGIALLYLGFGSLSLTTIAKTTFDPQTTALWQVGTICIFVGACFKLSLAPFHMWAPDVYQGAPTSTTALIATASKLAIFAVVIRYMSLFANQVEWSQVLIPIVVASILIGNLLALFQTNLKRLLAYSSVAHLGYAFVPLCVGAAWSASLIYIVTYLVTILSAFALLLMAEGDPESAGELKSYRGLAEHRPLLAAALALCFFSLAGIPMTAGFIGKWSIFQSALAGEQYLLVATVIVGAGLGIYYYLRVMASLYFATGGTEEIAGYRAHPIMKVIVAILLAQLLAIGLYPEPLLQQVRRISPAAERYGAACCHGSIQSNPADPISSD